MTNKVSHPGLSRAEQFDAAGRHDDAINELSVATQGGDLAAMTQLGKRLFSGDRSPCLPKEGAGLLFEATTKGHPDAVATMAVFQCIGVFQRKSWPDALMTLTHAAQLGHVNAQQQLALLAGEEIYPGTDWRNVAARIDLANWLQAPPGEVISADPLLKSFLKFLPLNFCQRLISQSRTRLKPARVYDPYNKKDVHSGTRTNSVAEYRLIENDVLHFLLQERMASACDVSINHYEATAILHYKVGEQIMNHYDFIDPALPNYEEELRQNGQRIITFLVYLNDEYSGGETTFPKLNINHKGQVGEGFFFSNALADGSADLRVLHAGSPPQSGEKWIVSQFIRNRPLNYLAPADLRR